MLDEDSSEQSTQTQCAKVDTESPPNLHLRGVTAPSKLHEPSWGKFCLGFGTFGLPGHLLVVQEEVVRVQLDAAAADREAAKDED